MTLEEVFVLFFDLIWRFFSLVGGKVFPGKKKTFSQEKFNPNQPKEEINSKENIVSLRKGKIIN